MAEALAKAEGEQDMEKKIEAALACPCLGALPWWWSARQWMHWLRGLRVAHATCRWLPVWDGRLAWCHIYLSILPCRGPEGGALWPCVCACFWLLHPQVRLASCGLCAAALALRCCAAAACWDAAVLPAGVVGSARLTLVANNRLRLSSLPLPATLLLAASMKTRAWIAWSSSRNSRQALAQPAVLACPLGTC